MSDSNQPLRGRVAALDGVRALAAIVVLFFHTRLPGFASGHIGVDIFFVLSGYLITSIMATEFSRSGRLDYWRFEKRRFLRLFPAMAVMLAVYWVSAPYLFGQFDRWLEVLLSGLYVSNWSRILIAQPIATQHTWSLAVEMQFYLLWPVIFVGMLSLFPKRIFVAVTVLLAAMVAWRFWLQYSGQNTAGRIYSSLDGRAPSLLAGALLAVSRLRLPPLIADTIGFLGALVLVGVVSGLALYGMKSAYRAPFVEIATVCVIIGCVWGDWFQRGLSLRPLAIAGLWSYSIYLWHYPIARLARENFPPLEATALTLALTLPIAAASYYFVELAFQGRRTSRAKATSPA